MNEKLKKSYFDMAGGSTDKGRFRWSRYKRSGTLNKGSEILEDNDLSCSFLLALFI